MGFVTTWIDQYGYMVLFFALMLELIALPVPGEVLMSYSGFLVSQGRLHWLASILFAGIGGSIGMTVAYLVGYKLGTPFFHKYGRRIHLGPEKLEKISVWFSKYGNKMLIIGYFIPGVRHITGYFAGITRIPFRFYAVYAYLGAFVWTSTFISLGKVLGPKWAEFHGSIKKYLIMIGIVAATVLVIVYFYRVYKQQILDAERSVLKRLLERFHSLGRVKFLVVGAATFFFVFFILMLGLIQDYLGNEFSRFDEIGTFLVHAIFEETWTPWMKEISLLSSYKVLIPTIALTLFWIWIKERDRWLESGFLLFVAIGGEILDEGLRRIFHRIGPESTLIAEKVSYTFPSEQSLIVFIVFGFIIFLFARHSQRTWVRTLLPSIVFVAAIFVGLSRVYLGIQYPSDVVAGYVFGGMWLSLNIVLLEIFRQLKKV